MKTEKQLQGLLGEDLATNLLLQKGYRILERNWRCGHLEVDIIAENDDYLVIVEVKTRKSVLFGAPEVFVDMQKQRHLVRAAMYYARFKNVTIGGNVKVISNYGETEIYEKLFRISEDDVIIGISFPRYSNAALQAMTFAKRRGAKAIALTDSMSSPLVAVSDYVLIAKSDIASVVDSLVAPLSMINALIAATVLNLDASVKETFGTLENIWQEYDVYQNNRKDDAE